MCLASRFWQLKIASIPLAENPLCGYWSPLAEKDRVVAYPAAGSLVPLSILGSGMHVATYSALGLPFAFASQFAPGQLRQALPILHGFLSYGKT